jgi:hypothetical protein
MRTALVGIGRMENRYAREWVAWHLDVGFDHIYIIDNNRTGEEHFEDVLQDYIDLDMVTVWNWRNKVGQQKHAFTKAYDKIGCEYDWIAFFDFDEFLVMQNGNSMEAMLSKATANVVLINWKCYGDNGLVMYEDKPVMERFTKPLPNDLCVQYDRPENDHIKSIVRGGLKKVEFVENMHIPRLDASEATYQTASGKPCQPSSLQTFDGEVAVLNHYITKTAEEWVWRGRRAAGGRSWLWWQKTYGDRFFKYNSLTKEKEQIMAKEKTVAIVHYNTPELTEAAILSVRKHGGENYKVIIFDNSDERPFKKRMKGVKVINNTKGQIINFDKELEKYPDKIARIGVWGKCVYGSVKHMMSIQKLWDYCPDGFLLMDGDVLLKQSVDFMFMENQCCVGHIQFGINTNNKYNIDRLVPILCYINVPMCRDCGIEYFDPKRSFMIQGNSKGSWYDTGASFLEDVRSHKNGAHGKRIDIRPLMEHLKAGSWRNYDIKKQAEWLKKFENLWKPEAGKPETAK